MQKQKQLGILAIILVLVLGTILSACSASTVTVTNTVTTTAAGTTTTTTPAKTIVWKAQTYTPIKTAPYGPFSADEAGQWGAMMRPWTTWIEAASGGRLKIEWSEPGALFPVADSDQMVAQGVADMVWACGLYYPQRIPEGAVDFAPMSVNSVWDEQELFFRYGYYDLMKQVMASKGLVYEYICTAALQSIGTSFDSSTLASFKGRKIRALSAAGEFVAAMGGSPVNLPFAEQYQGMKLGTVEGWTSSPTAFESIKMKEVTKYYLADPILYHGPSHLLINPKSYAALPKDIQDMISNYTKYVQYDGAMRHHQQAVWCLKNAAKEYGIKIVSWSDADKLAAVKLASEQVWPKLAAASPDSAKLIEIIKKQLKDYGRL